MKEKIGVIGSGAMGSGIAQVASTSGHAVTVIDINADALKKAEQKLEKVMQRLVEKGKFSRETASEIQNRIEWQTNLSALKNSHLVIEAIVENLEIKQNLFRELEEILPDGILASNTSSLSIASIAASIKNPSRVIGLHFFNPAPLMPLVEVIPSLQTDSNLPDEMLSLMRDWNKIPVLAKDTPGFIVNRVARPFYGEALRIYDEGIADYATIDWAMKSIAGFRMGPFELMDYIGNDINYTVTETVFKAFYCDPRYKPSLTQMRMSEAGWLGRKSGKGYYDYSDSADNPKANEDQTLGTKIVERIVAMLMNEAIDALYLKIASAEDIDLAMTKGVNYPQGLLAWCDEWGSQKVLSIIEQLHATYLEARYRPSPLLRKMATNKSSFISQV